MHNELTPSSCGLNRKMNTSGCDIKSWYFWACVTLLITFLCVQCRRGSSPLCCLGSCLESSSFLSGIPFSTRWVVAISIHLKNKSGGRPRSICPPPPWILVRSLVCFQLCGNSLGEVPAWWRHCGRTWELKPIKHFWVVLEQQLSVVKGTLSFERTFSVALFSFYGSYTLTQTVSQIIGRSHLWALWFARPLKQHFELTTLDLLTSQDTKHDKFSFNETMSAYSFLKWVCR